MAGLAVALTVLPAPARAQTAGSCDGRVVSRVTIRRSERTIIDRARVPQWSRPVLHTLLLGAPTRETAIRPFLQLREGNDCTELRRAESERLLRLQPYLADATVRVVDEADGRVAIEVETTDDLRRIVGLGLDGARPTRLELGDANIDGTGRLAAASWRDGGAYRDGYGVRAVRYHLFGGPNLARLALQRAPLGTRVTLLAGHPFYTDFQAVAGTIGYDRDDSYATFVRPEGDPLALQVVTERQDLGAVWRLNNRGLFRVLAGGIMLRERRTVAQDAVIITDSGLVDPVDRTLTARYRSTERSRVGLVAGVRALRFAKVAGFDALEGTQDVSRGLPLSTIMGSSVGGGERGQFGSVGLFLGVGTARSYVGLRALADAQRAGGAWRDVVASGRLAWYAKPSPKRTRLVSAEFAGAWQDDIPYQLTLDEPNTGVRGYEGSRVAGARRVIARLEQRVTLPGAGRYVGMGVAAFADGAHMWRGSVPFGTTASRASVGVSLLAAVPRTSRGLGRVDVAVKLVPDDGAGAYVVRVGWQITGRVRPVRLRRACSGQTCGAPAKVSRRMTPHHHVRGEAEGDAVSAVHGIQMSSGPFDVGAVRFKFGLQLQAGVSERGALPAQHGVSASPGHDRTLGTPTTSVEQSVQISGDREIADNITVGGAVELSPETLDALIENPSPQSFARALLSGFNARVRFGSDDQSLALQVQADAHFCFFGVRAQFQRTALQSRSVEASGSIEGAVLVGPSRRTMQQLALRAGPSLTRVLARALPRVVPAGGALASSEFFLTWAGPIGWAVPIALGLRDATLAYTSHQRSLGEARGQAHAWASAFVRETYGHSHEVRQGPDVAAARQGRAAARALGERFGWVQLQSRLEKEYHGGQPPRLLSTGNARYNENDLGFIADRLGEVMFRRASRGGRDPEFMERY